MTRLRPFVKRVAKKSFQVVMPVGLVNSFSAPAWRAPHGQVHHDLTRSWGIDSKPGELQMGPGIISGRMLDQWQLRGTTVNLNHCEFESLCHHVCGSRGWPGSVKILFSKKWFAKIVARVNKILPSYKLKSNCAFYHRTQDSCAEIVPPC